MENKITLKNLEGKKEVFDCLFVMEDEEYNYIVYTNKKQDKNNDMICFFAKYKPDSQQLENINKKEEEKLKLILDKFRINDEK